MDRAEGNLAQVLSDLWSGQLTGMPGVPFVVLLQEATRQVVEEAEAAAGTPPLSTFFAPVLTGPTRTSGNAILSTVLLRSARVVALPRERQPRAAAVASVEIAGEDLFVASVHLENRLGWLRGFFGDRARRRQAVALLDALPQAGHGVLGGDMNTMLGPSEAALDVLLDRFPDTPEQPLRPTFRDRLVLDHLFFDVPDTWTVTHRVVDDRYGSDHHPVLGLITFGG